MISKSQGGWEDSGVLSSTRGKELQSFYARLRGFGRPGDDPVTRIAKLSLGGVITTRELRGTTLSPV